MLPALVVVAWLLIAAAGGSAMGNLSSVQKNDAAAFLPQSAESTRASERESLFRDEQSIPAIVAIDGSTTLTSNDQQTVRAFASGLSDLQIGSPTRSLGDYLMGEPVAVFSEDEAAAMIVLALEPELAEEDNGPVSLDNVVDAIATKATDSLGDFAETYVTGPAGYAADLRSAFAGIDGLLLLVAGGVVLVILIIVYRSPSLPFTVLFTAVFALAAAGLIVYHLARAGALTLNGQSQGILFILVVGAATDYCLLIVARYREELTFETDPREAMKIAWRSCVGAVSASAGTVALGLLTLMLSDLSSNASLGPIAAIGIACAYIAALTLLPALLLVAGTHSRLIFWPSTPKVGDTSTAEYGLWHGVSHMVRHRPRTVWLSALVVLVALGAFLPTLQAGGSNEADIFIGHSDAAEGEKVISAHFPAGGSEPGYVIVPEAKAETIADAIANEAGISSVYVETDAPDGGVTGAGTPKRVDGWSKIVVVTQAPAGDEAALDAISRVRETAHASASDSLVGGTAAQNLDSQLTSERDLRIIIPTVLVVIGVVLMLLLRSVIAALVLLVANIISFAAALGLSALIFNHILELPAADPTVPLYAFVFLVALGVDYSIFLMTRVREESGVLGDTRKGVVEGLRVTGGVITSAGVVLAATFGALGVIPLLFLVQLAIIVALGVLIDTIIVRSLLVPGVAYDIGPAIWWPSALWKATVKK